MKRHARVVMVAVVVVMLSSLPGCSGKTAAPVGQTYQLEFPSTEAVVATDTVQVFVFDGGQAGSDCVSLLLTRKAGGMLPRSLATGPAVAVCEAFADGTNGAVPGVPFGSSRTFLGVAQRKGKDFFVGCSTSDVSATSLPVQISLAAAGTAVTVPASTCTLQQKCAGGAC